MAGILPSAGFFTVLGRISVLVESEQGVTILIDDWNDVRVGVIRAILSNYNNPFNEALVTWLTMNFSIGLET